MKNICCVSLECTPASLDEKHNIYLLGKIISTGVRRYVEKEASQKIRTRNFPDGIDKSARARFAARGCLTTQWEPRKLFLAMTGYVITALLIKPLRDNARRIQMRLHRGHTTAITKLMEKATYPARHVCKDTIARVRPLRLLIEH